eukprot:CAMPEP_0197288694 /NCGR_PEP_ID=MMETSP0890-20130614/5857_1 /TAXON_ID=44058 ORGANISM="Aureoumbra lagunensis, Strain CCMP1510" /NCGR_SAMPLE_ID=MMETSP0890 /ASSEMBLY_ACC=CAM_ASM_000533 /LENGTH=230 /DNA_ID=CAMNT_0042759615 /DNA_START=140 /DNA_END=832 /DNA_ORIENTATION=-
MLALELRDDFQQEEGSGWERMDVSRKRRLVHSKMARMAKPEKLVRKTHGAGTQTQFEPVGAFVSTGLSESTDYIADTMYGLYGIIVGESEDENPGGKRHSSAIGKDVEEDDPVKNSTAVVDGNDTSDLCCICFEKGANAVFVNGCNHGGICYSCSIDVFITSGSCPFCRTDIAQIVIISLANIAPPTDDDPENGTSTIVEVIGPSVETTPAKTVPEIATEQPVLTAPQVS